MVNITSSSYINRMSFDKKEKNLFTQLTRCRTRKCSKLSKDFVKENKIFENQIDKTCPNISFKCVKNVTKKHGVKSKMLYTRFIKCGKEKCSKEVNMWKKYVKTLKKNRS